METLYPLGINSSSYPLLPAPSNHYSTSCLRNLISLLGTSHKWNHTVFVLCDWLVFCSQSSGIIHVDPCQNFLPFFVLNIPLYGYIKYYVLFIHSSFNRHVGCFQFFWLLCFTELFTSFFFFHMTKSQICNISKFWVIFWCFNWILLWDDQASSFYLLPHTACDPPVPMPGTSHLMCVCIYSFLFVAMLRFCCCIPGFL